MRRLEIRSKSITGDAAELGGELLHLESAVLGVGEWLLGVDAHGTHKYYLILAQNAVDELVLNGVRWAKNK